MNSKNSGSQGSQFFKRLLWNLGLLIAIGLVLYVLFPDIIRQVAQVYGLLFGPVIIILLVLAAAMPQGRRRRRQGRG